MNRCIKNILASDSWKSPLFILAIVTIALLIRKTDSLSNPQFWAEDGVIFFLQQYENGASAIVRPYAGYLHLIPRLIAFFADSFFPYSAIPFVYNYSSLMITLLVVASIFSSRFKVGHKRLLALAIVLVPHPTNEVFLNITNLQWILFISLIIVLMKEKPNPEYGNVNVQLILDFMIVIFCGLTGPFIILLTPFFVLRWIKNKDSYNSIITSAAITIALVQISFILFTPSQLQDDIFVLNLNAYSAVLGHKVFGGLFLGKDAAYKIGHYYLSIMYLCLIFLILKLSSANKKVVTLCLGLQLIMLIAVFYRFMSDPGVLVPASHGPRYFYIPYVMLAWSLIALLEEKERWKRTLTKTALIFILISSLTSDFHSRGFIDYNWELHSKSIGRKKIIIPINPKGWAIYITNPK